jgi:hypothetical protein
MNRDPWLNNVRVVPQPIIMGGGLDLMTPPFQLPPGFCRAAQNFECSLYGGYRRIAGYERFDGRLKPSDAQYAVLSATITGASAVGNTLNGATSGATGTIIALPGGSYVLTQVVGTFQGGENLNIGGGTIAVSTSVAIVDGASTPLLHAQYKNLAADVYRALIAAIPGSGNVLGVNLYNDVLYGFRNAVGGLTAAMYKSTASGWSLVALGRQLLFTAGNLSIAEGTTITGATSGATAVLKRQMLESGTYGASSAVGKFIFASVTGTFQNGENLQTGGVTRAVANGADTAITLLPGGRYEFVNANFTGSTDTKRMYGCDGVNKAFEFDGTTYCPITTGMTTDTPTHIDFHLYHLFLSFNASVQFSSVGFPYQWTPITGAGEFSMGDQITGFKVQSAGTGASATSVAALAVFTKGRLSILYGSSAATFQLVPYSDEIGAIPYTMQNLVDTIFLDIQGITDIKTTISFGNFTNAVLTNRIKSLLSGWRDTAIASSLSRDLSQYRLFFTNNYALYMTVANKKVLGVMPVLFPDVVRCAAQGIMSDNTEVAFFGSSDGMVYQLDKGTSFDGDNIEAYINLAYNFSNTQRLLKRYRPGVLEVSGNGYAAFSFGYSLGYGATDVIQPNAQSLVSSFSAVFWDSFVWDSFQWDGVTLSPSTFEMDGEAENVSMVVTSSGDYFQPFTISGGVLHISPRRELR